MQKRFISIWFRYLTTDWLILRQPQLKDLPFVFAAQERGRKVIKSVSPAAVQLGIQINMPLADARAMIPDVQSFDHKEGRDIKLLTAIGEWCIRYSPIVSVDDDGLILDVTGCTHLWGDERAFMDEISKRLKSKGYQVFTGMADTVGASWAISRFGRAGTIIPSGKQADALLSLHPAALRLDPVVLNRLQKLGLYQIRNFINMPRSVLRRRFGEDSLLKLAQALGQAEENIVPLQLPVPYQERLTCLEPIRTASGIEAAIQRLLETLCTRLKAEGNGLRKANLKCYRVDGKIVEVAIGTNSPSHHISHLFKLFELKIPLIAPGLGIELFIMEAPKVEEMSPMQEMLWTGDQGMDQQKIAELLDRISVRTGTESIHRYLPDEHYWPERSIRPATSIQEKPLISWRNDRPRPTQLLKRPEPIEVTAPIPDYPPMLFRYKGQLHHIKKADGPERIEREWWLDAGEHRDYYQVEDEHGQRYWLFRSGHYAGDKNNEWFLHGYFA